jgi:translation initiation factor 2 gamma subunit (eIF-2gamma)
MYHLLIILPLIFVVGYANAKIYKCDSEKCPRPANYISGGSSKDDSFPCFRPNCSGRFQLVRHVSFVDCPGHDILMATMLNGAAVMDAALLLIGEGDLLDSNRVYGHVFVIPKQQCAYIVMIDLKFECR